MARAARAIEEKIGAGDYYDAQQMVKMLYRRQCAKGQLAAAIELAVDCAGRFCAVGQYELAADLGKDLVVSLEDHEEPPSDEHLRRIEAVLAGIPPTASGGAAAVAKHALIQRALRWSTSTVERGHPRLHRAAADAYRSEGELGRCQAHLVFCGDGPALAELVREWRRCGYPNEADLFGLRALLILLSLDDVDSARSFWDALVGRAVAPRGDTDEDATAGATVADTSVPEPPEPPIQCGSFLLAACEARSLDFFRAVRAKYALVIRRDGTLDKYLDEVEGQVFGAQVQKGGLGAMLEALMGGLGSGG